MNVNQIMQMAKQLQQNPMQILQQRGININPDMAKNPQAIVQYMLNSGMVNQSQVNQAMQMARNLKI